MKDSLGRDVSYLRISVTDRCNLRCSYCMPEEGVPPKNHNDILSYEQILRFVNASVVLGIKKVRITGGEPLVRRGIVEFAVRLKEIEGIDEVNLTTNAVLLPQFAKSLKDAGLNSINIGLNTLKADRYRRITRRGDIKDVFRGIDAALEHGFDKVKLNVVMMKGINDDEVMDFVSLTRTRPLLVRFIELMPIAEAGNYTEMYLPLKEIKKNMLGIKEVAESLGNGPARYYKIPEHKGYIGFICALSDRFCGDCNRIRLTADGKLMTCLHAGEEFDIKGIIDNADTIDLAEKISHILKRKPEGHGFKVTNGLLRRSDCDRYMSQVGG